MSEAYDRRDITALLGDLRQLLEAPRTESTLYQALQLQASLIALLLGQVASLQMQVELLTKTYVAK
jgi:hypothetical protein